MPRVRKVKGLGLPALPKLDDLVCEFSLSFFAQIRAFSAFGGGSFRRIFVVQRAQRLPLDESRDS